MQNLMINAKIVVNFLLLEMPVSNYLICIFIHPRAGKKICWHHVIIYTDSHISYELELVKYI